MKNRRGHLRRLGGHGVIVGMLLSAVAFIGVSLATKPSEAVRLAPFFEDEALSLSGGMPDVPPSPEPPATLYPISEKVMGERTQLQVNLVAPGPLNWRHLVTRLKESHPAWVTPAGIDAIYRLTHPDMLACVTITRGRGNQEIWLKAEPKNGLTEVLRKELFAASD